MVFEKVSYAFILQALANRQGTFLMNSLFFTDLIIQPLGFPFSILFFRMELASKIMALE